MAKIACRFLKTRKKEIMADSPSGWWGIAIGLVSLVTSLSSLAWSVYNGRAGRKRGILVYQVGTPVENVVLALQWKVVYIVRISILNESPSRSITVHDYELMPPWKDDDLILLPDPNELSTPRSEYVISDSGHLRFPRDLVLNHRVDGQGRLEAGESFEGGLLFRGSESIPLDLGEEVQVKIRVTLQHGQSFTTMCTLRVDRNRVGLTTPNSIPNETWLEG
jgi:hypothetical protein